MPEPIDPTRTVPPPPQADDTAPGPTAPPDPAETIDVPAGPTPYTDLTPHARGGLGEVFRGTDPDLNRTVAVKRLQDRLADDPASRRRFLVEAEVTARLEHPGVVPVYSLFRDAAGRPGYAMRFVQGPTLADALRDYHAGPPDPVAFRRLLASFLQVCQTVAYAHSRGVIHRDLKPQNVMIGKFGETLVVDWGLAKVVGRTAGDRAGPAGEGTLVTGSDSGGTETQMGSAVGTPAYMSPEQAAGRWDVIDARSDVYGLGAVLYTVLTGKPPLEPGNWPELQQKIQRGDFPRPRQAKADVPRPLEAVCLRAMAADPPARYPSALALAADIERWLADEPVSVYREPLPARGRRWVRRHRTVVTAAAVLLIAALAAAAGGLVLLSRTNREVAGERNAARAAADEAEAVNAFLTDDLLGQADPDVNARDRQVTVEQVLARAAARIDGNPKFADKPAVEATLRLAIGRTYFKLSNLPEAERHLRRAADLRRAALGPDDTKTLAAREALADFLNRGPEKYAESEPLARETWEARARVLGPEHRDTLDSLDTYATALIGLGKVEEAITRYQECLAARRRVLGPDHLDTLTSVGNLASVLNEQGRYADVIPLMREVVAGQDRRGEESEYVLAVSVLVAALYMNGDVDEAEQLAARAADRARGRFGPTSHYTDRLRGQLVRIWADQGELDRAAELGREVVAQRRAALGPMNPLFGMALADFGRALVLRRQYAEGEKVLAEGVAIFTASPPPIRFHAAAAVCWRGAALTGLGRYAEAEPVLLAAAAAFRATPTTPRRFARLPAEHLTALYTAWGKPAEAAAWRGRLADPPPGGKR